jgi:CubicO group peptidase (beta-lactamase class C family)
MKNLYKMPSLFSIALVASTLVASARPVLDIASMPDGNLSITTTVSAGETNSLQVASSLSTNTVWDTVGTVISGGLPIQAEWTVTPTNNIQLFRLVGSGCWLTGVVTDSTNPTGLPISNAWVNVIQSDGEATPMEATTDAQGRFVLWLNEGVDIGSEYLAVSVSADSFRPREINVLASATNSIRLSLENTIQYYEPVQLDDGIQTGSLADSNLDTNLINQLLVKTVQPGSGGYTELHSLLIYKDGHLVVEEYYHGNNDYIDFEGGILRKEGDPSQIQWGRTNRHYLASVNKSLTATVAGIAFDQFGYSPTNFIAPLLPDHAAYFTNANKAAVTLHDMLTMQLGFVWDEWGDNDLELLWQSTNFTDFVLSRNNNGPQFEWRYNSASPNMLLRGLETMVPGTIRDWAHTNFYSKLGITDYDWQSQPDGLPEGAARMHMRSRDMLKVGITYLDNGVWDGTQVIPTNWVDEVSTVQAIGIGGNYSYFFWVRQLNGVTYISADGDGGQYINIFPDQNMVVVMTQGNYLGWPLYVNQANDMMGTYILPAVND